MSKIPVAKRLKINNNDRLNTFSLLMKNNKTMSQLFSKDEPIPVAVPSESIGTGHPDNMEPISQDSDSSSSNGNFSSPTKRVGYPQVILMGFDSPGAQWYNNIKLNTIYNGGNSGEAFAEIFRNNSDEPIMGEAYGDGTGGRERSYVLRILGLAESNADSDDWVHRYELFADDTSKKLVIAEENNENVYWHNHSVAGHPMMQKKQIIGDRTYYMDQSELYREFSFVIRSQLEKMTSSKKIIDTDPASTDQYSNRNKIVIFNNYAKLPLGLTINSKPPIITTHTTPKYISGELMVYQSRLSNYTPNGTPLINKGWKDWTLTSSLEDTGEAAIWWRIERNTPFQIISNSKAYNLTDLYGIISMSELNENNWSITPYRLAQAAKSILGLDSGPDPIILPRGNYSYKVEITEAFHKLIPWKINSVANGFMTWGAVASDASYYNSTVKKKFTGNFTVLGTVGGHLYNGINLEKIKELIPINPRDTILSQQNVVK